MDKQTVVSADNRILSLKRKEILMRVTRLLNLEDIMLRDIVSLWNLLATVKFGTKKTSAAWFHPHVVPRTVRFIELECRQAVARGSRRREWRASIYWGHTFSLNKMKGVLETVVVMVAQQCEYLMQWTRHLKMVKMVISVMCIYHIINFVLIREFPSDPVI